MLVVHGKQLFEPLLLRKSKKDDLAGWFRSSSTFGARDFARLL